NTANCTYNARISLLPRRSIAIKESNNVLAPAYEYQGFWFRSVALRGLLWAQDHFKPHPAATLVASYPKTGTTWLKALTFSIATRNRFDLSSNPLKASISHQCIPFLELEIPRSPSHKYYPDVPLFSTHVPYTCLPDSIPASDCKILYIWRDPTDTFVSWWHFARKVAPEDMEFVPIEEGFQQFAEGYSLYGPYWEQGLLKRFWGLRPIIKVRPIFSKKIMGPLTHGGLRRSPKWPSKSAGPDWEHVLGYWRASLDRPGQILFLKYEDLKLNTSFYVKKLADFIGSPFSIEEERDGVVERIIDLCSFKHMSGLEVNKSGKHSNGLDLVTLRNSTYFRKAEVGDWKNHLPAKVKEQMDQIMELKLKDSGLTFGSTSNS
ncbi:flavonol sulfotransferase-like, partial [Daucus carota subsp. sativus]|uniref:flavonol sulfotransferase-like n=1 Tax=Daucus carota subsp. sativus TaxID=79200 RepID=UPI003083CFBB